MDKTGVEYFPDDILAFLKQRKKLLDGVVISGGEPLLNEGLLQFLKRIKSLDYLIKIDTNGTSPHNLKELVYSGVVDYIAMDIKATYEKYEQITMTDVDLEAIEQSIEFIMGSGVDYEFRTTIIPQLSKNDLVEMAKYIKGARLYALQQYRKPKYLNGNIQPLPYKKKFFEETKEEISKIVENVILRGL